MISIVYNTVYSLRERYINVNYEQLTGGLGYVYFVPVLNVHFTRETFDFKGITYWYRPISGYEIYDPDTGTWKSDPVPIAYSNPDPSYPFGNVWGRQFTNTTSWIPTSSGFITYANYLLFLQDVNKRNFSIGNVG